MHVHNSPFKRFSGKHVVAVFDTPGQFISTIDSMSGKRETANEMRYGKKFFSGDDWAAMKTKCVEGDKAFADKASKLMREIDSVNRPTVKRQRIASPYGRVNIGAYLASDPQPCRRKIAAPRDDAPLSIVVSLNSMANVPADALERRGLAIAALARRVASVRPLALYLSRFSEAAGENSAMLVRFPTTPIDVYRLAYLLSSQGFARGGGFAFHRSAKDIGAKAGMAMRDVSTTGWISFAGGPEYSQTRNCSYSRDLSEFLNSELLYIPGSDPSQREFNSMINNPVQWINDTMSELTKTK